MTDPTYQAGWYQHENEWRYHDGEEWTEHRSTVVVVCAKCGSRDVKKVGRFSKMGMVIAAGVFSVDSVEKTYRCGNWYTRW